MERGLWGDMATAWVARPAGPFADNKLQQALCVHITVNKPLSFTAPQ